MNIALPEVTIGLVTYNHAAFIESCLDSIKAQTCRNIRLLISDDCSTDQTATIIERYMQNNPGVVAEFYHQTENIGISANCNFLIDKVDTEFFFIFSGDDLLLPNKVDEQLVALRARPDAVFCFSNIEWFWSDSDKKICNHFGLLQRPSTDIGKVLEDFSVPSPTLMIRTAKIGKLRYNKDLPYINDCLFILQMMTLGECVYVPKVLVRYRKHRGSLTLNNYFYHERQRLLELLSEVVPARFANEIQRYRYTVSYAEIMWLIGEKRRLLALKRLKNILPVVFSTPKWFMRFMAVLYRLARGV